MDRAPEPLLDEYKGFKLKHNWQNPSPMGWTTKAYYDGVLITLDRDANDPLKSQAGVLMVLDTLCYWADNERKHREK
jgi:hypothetical protein